MFDTDKPTDSQIVKARRKLHGLARPGGALVEQGGGRTGLPATYRAAIRVLESEVTGVTEGVTHPSGTEGVTNPTKGSRVIPSSQVTEVTVGVTAVTHPGGHASPLALKQGEAPLPFVFEAPSCPDCLWPMDSIGHEVNCEIPAAARYVERP
jgi:hypothetical protein